MPHLAISLLGPPQLHCDGRPITALESSKVRALLAYLVLEAARPLPRAALAALLWPEAPERAARHSLRQALANLRQTLGDQDAAAPLLLITRDEVQLARPDALWLDVARFQELLDASERHPHRRPDACPACAERLAAAAALYRGDFMAHFFVDGSPEFEGWIAARRAALQQRACRALGLLAACYERQDRYAEAQQTLARLLELEPWHEEAHRALMQVLARGGQRSAALAQFERCRALLQDELRAAPDPLTVALHASILRSSSQTLEEQRRAEAGRRRPALPPGPYVERPAEQASLAEHLAAPQRRLISLVGPGGIGKTRLALQSAAEHALAFDDGVCVVPLAALTAAAQIPRAILAALGITPEGPDPQRQLTRALETSDLLLLLDSFEHLIEGAELVAALLRATDRLTVLITSRQRLHLQAEWVVPLGGMPLPPDGPTEQIAQAGAVRLFLSYARRADPLFQRAPPDLQAIARICRLVGGVPLAIELAAAWVRVLPCAEIAQELERGLDVLTTALRDAPERHRSMQAVFEHSWRLLDQAERGALRRLAVFQGGWSREAAERVAGAPLPVLTALLDKSLLRRAADGRYHMHELVHQYAHERLAAAGELLLARAAHRDDLLALAEQAGPALLGAQQSAWLDRLEAENDNLRAALRWSFEQQQHQTAARFCAALWRFWHIRGHQSEGYRWITTALAASGALPPDLRAASLYGAGWLAYDHEQFEPAMQFFEASLAIFRAQDDRRGMGQALHGIGEVAMRQGHSGFAQARACFEASLELFRALDDREEAAWSLSHIGRVASLSGDLAGAHSVLEQGLASFRGLGHAWGIAVMLYNLGEVALQRADLARAADLFEECGRLNQTLGSGRNHLSIYSRVLLGQTLLHQGHHERARAALEEGLRMARALNSTWSSALALRGLAELALRQGDQAQAQSLLAEGLLLQRLERRPAVFTLIVETRAALALDQGDPRGAARLCAAAELLRETYQIPVAPLDWPARHQTLAALRALLDPDTLARLWAEGRALSRDQIVELCLP